jgi:hypothetical protein
MKPSGPNRWQQVANATAPKAAKRAKTVAVVVTGCRKEQLVRRSILSGRNGCL